ncbi:hypothetical protein SAY87_019323 [Trapa incisa]|uniref:C2H2-type domain-containing protein n=1 Tax=Trapa incisa TaxID=236973 RepID=A0AAN7K289_9MYRT|nr:hypothetical protein SAY87_019323 [Trapa incisa]
MEEAPGAAVPISATAAPLIPLPKGKRTREQMAQSPFALPVFKGKVSKMDPLSSVESSEVSRGGQMVTEDEDMARCLILLSRGQFQGDQEGEQEANNDVDGYGDNHGYKFRSKRQLDTGESVYQCKTCDKVFPSFQALGGHRASHKKPKIGQLSPWRPFPASTMDYEDTLSLKLMSSKRNSYDISSKRLPKLHECLTCGAEFSSGQALGGHMRRHRALMTGPAPALVTPKTPGSEEPLWPRSKAHSSLQLDLNLPAPEDDGLPINSRDQAKRDMSNLAFSFPPTLVGCQN